MQETTYQTEILELFHLDPFMGILEEVSNCMPVMINITDEGSWQNIPDLLDNELEKEEMVCTFDLLIKILHESITVEDVIANVDAVYQKVLEIYEENIMAIFTQTKPFEKTIRSLNLLYENAGGEAEVFILPVNASKFANSANPKHFNIMRDYLRKKFYAFKMEDSPFYISFVGDIGSKSAMELMAEVAMETRALAILDTKESSSVNAIINHAKRLRIQGISPKHAHMVIPATYLYALEAKDTQFIRTENGKLQRVDRKMSVPAASAIIGKLLDVRPGVFISGLEADAIVGIDGVKLDYDKERIDSKELDKVGLVQIEQYGHIQGTSTANCSNNDDLRKFPKVDTANALLKDLVQYCNNKAFSKWGEKYKRAFEREINSYLNRRIKQELIQGYEVNDISFDKDEESVNIDISVVFYEVADEFDIKLHGPKGGIDVKKDSGN